MLKIKAENVVIAGHRFDYELEDGTLLHEDEWNGEHYTISEKGQEIVYRPIYADEPNENDGFDIIGFEERRY